jgi:hypothetical protein
MAKKFSGTQDEKVRRESAVRAAAIAAARGVPLSEDVLLNILAKTNEPGLSDADRISRATSMAEQYVAAPKPVNLLSATPAQLAALGKQEGIEGGFIHGVWVPGASATSRGGNQFAELKETGARSGVSATVIAEYTKQYAGMGFTPDAINTFAAVGLGAHDYRELEGRGLKAHEIVAAAHDTKTMGMTGKDDVEHAHYTDTGVKDHLKRAHRAQTHRDGDTARREVDNAVRGNEAITDQKKRAHGDALIHDFKVQHGMEADTANSKPRAISNPSDVDAARKLFEQLKAQRAKAPTP